MYGTCQQPWLDYTWLHMDIGTVFQREQSTQKFEHLRKKLSVARFCTWSCVSSACRYTLAARYERGGRVIKGDSNGCNCMQVSFAKAWTRPAMWRSM